MTAMTTIGLSHYLILSAALFAIGLIGLTTRRNIIVLFMCVELMLNSANLTILAYARQFGDSDFHAAALFVMVIAASEAALGLAMVVAMFRYRGTVDSDKLTILKG